MFYVISYALLAFFGYFFPKIGLSISIILSSCWVLAYILYKPYYSYFTNQTIEYIEDMSRALTPITVITEIVVFCMFYYFGLCDNNFEHTVANQWFISTAVVMLGIEFTVKPK